MVQETLWDTHAYAQKPSYHRSYSTQLRGVKVRCGTGLKRRMMQHTGDKEREGNKRRRRRKERGCSKLGEEVAERKVLGVG